MLAVGTLAVISTHGLRQVYELSIVVTRMQSTRGLCNLHRAHLVITCTSLLPCPRTLMQLQDSA